MYKTELCDLCAVRIRLCKSNQKVYISENGSMKLREDLKCFGEIREGCAALKSALSLHLRGKLGRRGFRVLFSLTRSLMPSLSSFPSLLCI